MAEKIIKQNVAEAAEDYSCIFGANKNLYRTIPSFVDGLKPGKRRIFWSWWENSGKPTNTKPETLKKLRNSKVANIAANAMVYHPHGNIAIEEVLTGEGRYWTNNVMTIVPQGNYGSIRGDSVAAGRYLEARMSEYLIDCFFDDFNKYCLPMKPSYDGERMEPEYLPAKYPHALFNPQFSGIGYGLASNIPPFNVGEVLKATIKLIKNKNANILLIPDIPTGADIVDEGLFAEMNNFVSNPKDKMDEDKASFKITMKATAEIDYTKNIIRFVSLPLQTSAIQVIANVSAMRKKGDFQDILEIQDFSQNGEADLRFILKSTTNPDEVLKKLYKKNTSLKSTFPVKFKLIDDYREFNYGIRQYLVEWIEYRRDIVRSMYLNYYQQTIERQHLNDVLLLIFNGDNASTTLDICQHSKNRADIINRLMKHFNKKKLVITSLQASTVADMRMYHFSEEMYEKFKEEKIELAKRIKEITDILDDEKLLDKIIIRQLEEGIKKYGHPRKSKIVKDDKETSIESIPNTNHLIGVSETGYIKKIDLNDAMIFGKIGKHNDNASIIPINNREDILVIDSEGFGIRIPVSSIPTMTVDDIGVEIARYFKCSGKIVTMMQLPDKKAMKNKNNCVCITIVTKNGFMKRVKLSEFKGISEPRSSITLNDGDEVVSAMFTVENSEKDVIIYTNDGYGLRLPIDSIKISGKAAKGTRKIDLQPDQYVVNASKIDPKKKILFYITTAGRVKLTQEKYFPVSDKREDVLQLITLTGNETLLYVASVNRKDTVRVYYRENEPMELPLKDLEISMRKAVGKKMVRVPRGDTIVSVKIVSAQK